MDHISSAPSLVAPTTSTPEALRLQHLYTLAFADRMRFLQPFSPFPSLIPQHLSAQRFAPPADLAMFPLAKLDPRLFRIPFPEEPKPQHSYIGLIAMSILSSGEKKLVLADIYQYILDNFPYFRHRGPGWRNSIRHNLSLNDCFIKSGRASNGKGHFWAVHPACQDDFQKGDFSRRKAQRKVRRYLGMNVGVDEEDTPPSSPSFSIAEGVKLESESLKDEGASFKLETAKDDAYKVNPGHLASLLLHPSSPQNPASLLLPSSSPQPLSSLLLPSAAIQPSAPLLEAPRSPQPPASPPSSATMSQHTCSQPPRPFSFGIDSLLQREEKKPRIFLQ